MTELFISFGQTDWIDGLFIFLARVADVSLGTLRTIAIVHGRTVMASGSGFSSLAFQT